MNRLTNAHIGRATTEVGHCTINIVIARGRLFAEQVRCRHDRSRLAVAALRYVERAPGALHRMIAVSRQPFDRRHLAPLQGGDRYNAGARGPTVDMHGAGAAGADAAPELASGQPEMLAHDPQQRNVGWAVELCGFLIDREAYQHRVLFDLSCHARVDLTTQAAPACDPD